MNSAIYCGQVRHRRSVPVVHEFSYGMFMLYLDLAELEQVFAGRWLWSARRLAAARFRRDDHLGDADVPLDVSVRDLVQRETGCRPAGPIRLLTHLRYFGYVFNPVSFYYCFDRDAEHVETIVAEVTNTPWGERHCYVLPRTPNAERGSHIHAQPAKAMHVSPFMEMEVAYDWRFSAPGGRLAVHMENRRKGVKIFDATLDLRRRAITGGSLARALLRYPLMTLQIIVAIHWQALMLWMKGSPVYDHPDKTRPGVEEAA